ncbi:hypothetical protein [Stenomitos frigidus]|uniref:Uncharacterized protein n=1 Tax=Stenomitos frigidus ULC18 TaxID=2107698 RepID=A0A2T1ERB4_9CYAN|nr:hypothetical protein [Stenomitos frigidus]PSB35251.1 hypothetical protein C7B82_01245 [Stenomitos frigidus ULC18]
MQAQALDTVTPNLYELQGYDKQITFSTTSITGVPQLSYNDRGEVRTFSGSDILTEETGLGQMVTVQLKNNQADEGFESLTLLLPAVQLSPKSRELSIQTMAILSKRVVFVNPTEPIQLQQYDTIELAGTAKNVNF